MEQNIDALIGLTDTMEGALSKSVDANDGVAISNHISVLAALISVSVSAVALSEKLYNVRLGKELRNIPPGTSATDKKLILSGRLSEEIYWQTFAERQNAGITHAIDGYRSMLSFLKEEMKINQYQNT